jgi:hypothetical protein
MRLSNYTLSLLAVGALGLFAPAANAQIQTLVVNATPIPLTSTEFRLPLTAPKFNTALGTLLSVKLDLGVSIESDITVQNVGSSPSDGSVFTRLFAWIADPALQLTDPGVNNIGVVQPGAFIATVETPLTDFPAPGDQLDPNETFSILDQVGSSSASNTFSNAAFIDQFKGGPLDTITMTGATDTFTVLSFSGGNTNAAQTTLAQMNLQITYTYTAGAVAPEPSALGLLAVGLPIGLGIVRRRRA